MKKPIEVFDFNEEDELAESAAGKLLEKFENPSPCNSPVLQRQRIQSLCNEKRVQKHEPEGPSCVEPATTGDDHHCEDAPTLITEAEESRTTLTFRLETSDHLKETDAEKVNHGLMFGLNTQDLAKETDADHDNHRMIFGLNTEDGIKETDVDHGLQEQNDMMSAINESLSDRSALSETSDSKGDEDWMAEHLSNDVEKIDISTAVIMTSEYVILRICTVLHLW